LIVPYNPQQNGVVERKKRAIVGAARSMLHDQAFPFYLWAEACSTAVYLQNKSPHRALGRKTPEEAFTGSRPDVEHLRIFGCLTFSHMSSEKRTKLDPTTEKGILVGFSEVYKAYRIYIPTLRRVVVRRDVRLEEDRAFVRSLELRDRVEEVPHIQSDASQGTQPQVSSTPSSGVTGPPVTTSGSQLLSIQTIGAGALGSQTTLQRFVHETQGHEKTTPPEVTSGKKKPRWFQETLKEAKEYVGEPQRLMRESRVPKSSHLAIVMSSSESEPTSDEQVAGILTESLPRAHFVRSRGHMLVVGCKQSLRGHALERGGAFVRSVLQARKGRKRSRGAQAIASKQAKQVSQSKVSKASKQASKQAKQATQAQGRAHFPRNSKAKLKELAIVPGSFVIISCCYFSLRSP
jgi:hypothetical protein